LRPIKGSRIRGGAAYRQHKALKDLVRLRDNCTCQICGKPGWDVDHIIPHAEGGLSTPDNLRVLCHRCNCQRRRPRANARLPLPDYYAALEAELAAAQAARIAP